LFKDLKISKTNSFNNLNKRSRVSKFKHHKRNNKKFLNENLNKLKK